MPLIEPNEIEDEQLRTYAATGYTEVNGWGVGPYHVSVFLTLDRYQKDRGVLGNVFEIGVYEGRVAVLLGLMARPDERLIAVDVFETLGAHNIDGSGSGATRAAFEANVARHGLSNRTDLIVADSMFLDFRPKIERVRLAHIDGGHYVDAIVNDLVKTQDVMVPGGIISVDDWNHNAFTGVNEGCHRFLSYATPRRVIPFCHGNNNLLFTTHSHHADLV